VSADRERAELFAKLPLETLRRVRNEASAAGNLQMADEARRALNLRAQSQNEEIENGGQLFAHHHPPSPENGWRASTTFTGDPAVWMAPFISGGQFGTINREAGVVARQAVDLRAGERVQIIGPDGRPRTA